MTQTPFALQSIGVLQSCFKEKFGVARQSLMTPAAQAMICMKPEFSRANFFEHLEGFSHIWVIFLFHKNIEKGWRPQSEPPRVEGPERVGVFASRSPHRPNFLGLSCVKLEKIVLKAESAEIHVSGADILDGTPIFDIKPYLPFADSLPKAQAGWASQDISKYSVLYSNEAVCDIARIESDGSLPNLRTLLQQMLELDPRPTAQRKALPLGAEKSQGRNFAFRLGDFDVQWRVRNGGIFVERLVSLSNHCTSSLAPAE